ADNEVFSMMNVKVRHEEPSTQTPSLLTILVSVIPETYSAAATTIHPHIPPITPLLQLSTLTPTPTTKLYTTKFEKKAQAEKKRYIDFIEKSLKDLINDEVKTQLPQILPKESSLYKGTKSQPKSYGKSAQVEESVFEVANIEMPQNQGSDLGYTGDQPNVEATLKHDWFKKPERPSSPNPD
nr:hypothetical protein [Tanacetum cinerariifolium]